MALDELLKVPWNLLLVASVGVSELLIMWDTHWSDFRCHHAHDGALHYLGRLSGNVWCYDPQLLACPL